MNNVIAEHQAFSLKNVYSIVWAFPEIPAISANA